MFNNNFRFMEPWQEADRYIRENDKPDKECDNDNCDDYCDDDNCTCCCHYDGECYEEYDED